MATRTTKPAVIQTMTSQELEDMARELGLTMVVTGTQFVLSSAYALTQHADQFTINAIRKVADELSAGNPLRFSYDKYSKEFQFMSSQSGTNGDRGGHVYVATTSACTCPAGENKKMCRHQAAALLIRSMMSFVQEGRTILQARELWKVAVMGQTLHATN